MIIAIPAADYTPNPISCSCDEPLTLGVPVMQLDESNSTWAVFADERICASMVYAVRAAYPNASTSEDLTWPSLRPDVENEPS